MRTLLTQGEDELNERLVDVVARAALGLSPQEWFRLVETYGVRRQTDAEVNAPYNLRSVEHAEEIFGHFVLEFFFKDVSVVCHGVIGSIKS